MSASLITDRTQQLSKAINGLVKREVLVGVPDGRTDRMFEVEQDVHRDADITNAALAYVHEFGSPAKNIPARPFLIPGVQNQGKHNEQRLRLAALAALDGDMRERNRQLEAVGQESRDAAKAMIRSNIQPALAASTLAARHKRGKTSEHTLIDSGQLLNAMNYLVKSTHKSSGNADT